MPILLPTVCLWDFESLRVEDYLLQPLFRRIREVVTNEVGRNAEKAFLVACDVRNLPASTTRHLNKIRNLDIVHVDTSQNSAAEEKIKQKLHQFDIDYRDDPGVIVLVSGNEELSYFLSNMGRSGWRVVLFHPQGVSKELLDCVDYHQDLSSLIDDIEATDPLIKPTTVGECDKAYLLVANIPAHLTPDRVVAHLHMATEEFGGRVSYLNQLTGEAVLTYNSFQDETKGATALYLAKNCKALFGYDLGVLAIKDPCGELARMKFTVQQVSNPPAPAASPPPLPRSRHSSYASTGDTNTDGEALVKKFRNMSCLMERVLDGKLAKRSGDSPSSGISSLSQPTSPRSGSVHHHQTPPHQDPSTPRRTSAAEEVVMVSGETVEETIMVDNGYISEQHSPHNPPFNAHESMDENFPDLCSSGEAGLISSGPCNYANAVKKPPSPHKVRPPGMCKEGGQLQMEQLANVAPLGDSSQATNGYRPYFQKPAMQCFHWDNPSHLTQSLRECKFWHPRERCRFYPQCMMGADSCGYAHPFCGVYCECGADQRDSQRNHRLKAPAYMKVAPKEKPESSNNNNPEAEPAATTSKAK